MNERLVGYGDIIASSLGNFMNFLDTRGSYLRRRIEELQPYVRRREWQGRIRQLSLEELKEELGYHKFHTRLGEVTGATGLGMASFGKDLAEYSWIASLVFMVPGAMLAAHGTSIFGKDYPAFKYIRNRITQINSSSTNT